MVYALQEISEGVRKSVCNLGVWNLYLFYVNSVFFSVMLQTFIHSLLKSGLYFVLWNYDFPHGFPSCQCNLSVFECSVIVPFLLTFPPPCRIPRGGADGVSHRRQLRGGASGRERDLLAALFGLRRPRDHVLHGQ